MMRRSDHLPLVAAGGVCGASVRWSVAELVDVESFPWPTLLVNVVGCALLGFVMSSTVVSTRLNRFLAVGFCGGLTTLSTLSLDVVELLDARQPARAATYLGASLVLGLVAFITVRQLVLPKQTHEHES